VSCFRAARSRRGGETEEEILSQAAVHAKRDHGVQEIDAATLAKVKAAIRTV
jgi:predicted small metal-binding protein